MWGRHRDGSCRADGEERGGRREHEGSLRVYDPDHTLLTFMALGGVVV